MSSPSNSRTTWIVSPRGTSATERARKSLIGIPFPPAGEADFDAKTPYPPLEVVESDETGGEAGAVQVSTRKKRARSALSNLRRRILRRLRRPSRGAGRDRSHDRGLACVPPPVHPDYAPCQEAKREGAVRPEAVSAVPGSWLGQGVEPTVRLRVRRAFRTLAAALNGSCG